MKQLNTSLFGIIGPVSSAVRHDDHWLIDDVVYPDIVIGNAVLEDYEYIPVVNPPVVPAEITMRQARLALLGAGKLAAVNAAIASMPEPQKSAASIEWEYSNSVLRHNGFVSALGPMLGLTNNQIDQLFIVASTL